MSQTLDPKCSVIIIANALIKAMKLGKCIPGVERSINTEITIKPTTLSCLIYDQDSKDNQIRKRPDWF